MNRGELPELLDARILIIDDNEPVIALLEALLTAAGYRQLSTVTDSRKAVAACRDFNPDLILLGSDLEGLEILRQLTESPLLVMTADSSPESRSCALSLGANDFVNKPLDAIEVKLRVRNLLHQRVLQLHNQELADTQVEILGRLALAAEYRDDETGQHTMRVGAWSAMVAEALGHSKQDVEMLRVAAPLHDIGKIGIPDRVLLKAGPLTPEERRIMQSHTTIGAEMLGRSASPLLQLARHIALCHHERWDGLGYPGGFKGELTPLSARIVAVVDTYDALTHKRPYKPAWMRDRALDELCEQSGRQFDPNVLQVFIHLVEHNDLVKLAGNVGLDGTAELPRHALI